MPAVILPANSYLCWQITVIAVDKGGLELRYDSNNQQTSITTPSIVVPEHGSPFIGLVLLIPLVAGGQMPPAVLAPPCVPWATPPRRPPVPVVSPPSPPG